MKKASKQEREEIEREMKESAKQHVRTAVNPQRGFGC
jgi:hypothetical protein